MYIKSNDVCNILNKAIWDPFFHYVYVNIYHGQAVELRAMKWHEPKLLHKWTRDTFRWRVPHRLTCITASVYRGLTSQTFKRCRLFSTRLKNKSAKLASWTQSALSIGLQQAIDVFVMLRQVLYGVKSTVSMTQFLWFTLVFRNSYTC